MKSLTTRRFRALFAAAPESVRNKMRAAHILWSESPADPSLKFKKVHASQPIYSMRIDLDCRAPGLMEGDTVVWFWVGPHSEYDRLLRCVPGARRAVASGRLPSPLERAVIRGRVRAASAPLHYAPASRCKRWRAVAQLQR